MARGPHLGRVEVLSGLRNIFLNDVGLSYVPIFRALSRTFWQKSRPKFKTDSASGRQTLSECRYNYKIINI